MSQLESFDLRQIFDSFNHNYFPEDLAYEKPIGVVWKSEKLNFRRTT